MEKIKQYWKEGLILILITVIVNIGINSIFKKEVVTVKTQEQKALEGFQLYLQVLDEKRVKFDSTKAELEQFEAVLKKQEAPIQQSIKVLKEKKVKLQKNVQVPNIDTNKLNELIIKYSSSKN